MFSYPQVIKFSQALQKAILVCFHFLILTLPFIYTSVNDELFEFNKMLFVYLMSIVIGALWLLRMVIEKKVLLRQSIFDWAILAFVCSQLISTFVSMHPATSWLGYYTRFHGGLLSTLAYVWLYYAFVSNLQAKQLINLLWTLTLGATLASLYAIPEHFGHSFSCIFINDRFDVSCWIQDVQHRIFGSFGQPNWLAAYMVSVAPVIMVLGLAHLPKTKPGVINVTDYLPAIASAVSVWILLIALLFSGSRSGFLGFGVAWLGLSIGLVIMELTTNKRKQNLGKRLQFMPWLAALTVGLAAGAVIWGTPFSPSITDWINRQNVASPPATSTSVVVDRLDQGGTDSAEIRKIVWKGAIKVWQRYPWFGSGVETFAYSYYQDRPVAHNLVSEWDFLYNKAHNEFLNFLATTGLVGLVSYLGLMAVFCLISVRLYLEPGHPDAPSKLIALGLLMGYLGLAVSNFWGFSTVTVGLLFFLYPGMVVLLSSPTHLPVRKNPMKTKQSSSDSSRWWYISGSLAVLSATAMGLAWISQTWLADYYYKISRDEYQANQLNSSLDYVNKALELKPSQPVYYNHASQVYAKLAVTYAQEQQLEQAQAAVEQALLTSQTTLELNPVHLNFYKTQINNLITLSQLNLEFLAEAKRLSELAITLAPTDPKLYYFLGLIEIDRGETQLAVEHLAKAIELRPNYQRAREYLAQEYQKANNLQAALDQYDYILDNLDPNNPIAIEQRSDLQASISAQSKK